MYLCRYYVCMYYVCVYVCMDYVCMYVCIMCVYVCNAYLHMKEMCFLPHLTRETWPDATNWNSRCQN